MSQLQPVFFTMSPERRTEFLLETRIWNKNGRMFAEKRAAALEAEPHLERMLSNYRTLSKLDTLSSLVSVVPAAKSGATLEFDYIAGVSAERLLLEKILSEDTQGAFAIIDKLFAIIDSMPGQRVNPATNQEYLAVFGETFNKVLDCTKPGIIDLNLNNFIIDEAGRWHLYDYEWLFDFPVPKKLLRVRFLWYFLNRHKEILRYHAQRIESLTVGKALYTPKFIYQRYQKELMSLPDLAKAETNFQVYVTGVPADRFARLRDGGFAVEEAVVPAQGIEATIQQGVREGTKAVKAELQTERARRVAAEQKLNAIIASRSYKLAKKAGSVKRKLLGD